MNIYLEPVAKKVAYKPNDFVSFQMKATPTMILPNSLRISGTLGTRCDGTNDYDKKNIFIDNAVGVEAFAQQITTAFNGQVMEQINNYPRYRKMKMIASRTVDTLGASGTNGSAMRTGSEKAQTRMLLEGDKKVSSIDGVNYLTSNFSFKPDICLNNTNGMPVCFSKSGDIELTLRLSQIYEMLFGASVSVNSSYVLTDLRLNWKQMPEDPQYKKQPLTMVVKTSIQQVAASNNQQFSLSVPIPASSFVASLMKTADVNSPTANNYRMDKVQINSVEMSYNDVNMVYNQFQQDNQQIINYNFLKAMNNNSPDQPNAINLVDFLNNEAFGIGSNFGKFLSNTKFGINLQSNDITSTNTYTIWFYFIGSVSV